MARGDALKFLGQIDQAWDELERAGALFLQANDPIGWARTRIGRLALSTDLNRVAQALDEAQQAREILEQRGEYEKRLRLDINLAAVFNTLGDHRRALAAFQAALATAQQLGAAGEMYLGGLANNIGYTYLALGDLPRALDYSERARSSFAAHGELAGAALAERSIAYIHALQGDYRQALDVLHQAYDRLLGEDLPRDATCVSGEIIDCYLRLNRFAEARDLAREVRAAYRSYKAALDEGRTLLSLGVAEAELGQLDAAQRSFDEADRLFEAYGATVLRGTVRLRRGRLALRRGDRAMARAESAVAIGLFDNGGLQVEFADALLLDGQAAFQLGDLAAAESAGLRALDLARRTAALPLRYSAHLLLGRVAEARGAARRARRRYGAAVATVERIQRGLTITLRSGFLEDKGEALRALATLHLRSERADCAFETIERAKSQALLSYLNDHEQFHWATDDPRNRRLLDELGRLREEHHWLYRLAHDPAGDSEFPRAMSSEQAQIELSQRERRMRALTEQLYLHAGGSDRLRHVQPVSLREIQASLADDQLLIAYYNDGAQHWAFSIDRHTIESHALTLSVESLDRLIGQWQLNVGAALTSDDPAARRLTGLGQRLLQRLYSALLDPLEARLAGRRRLTIVPYGALHYLPFHLLHSGAAYLIERHEVVVLPAAALVTRRAPQRTPGSLTLAHSWQQRLPQTLTEAQIVGGLFGGRVIAEDDARRSVLDAPPVQILHIAAHGEHRLDQPDLSYIQLADGQLYTDDLLQHDLSYELVTLSACETGRANVAAGDELIGLGRGFLYAGAGALLMSLWRIPDDTALRLMQQMYAALERGVSKAAALRDAQRSLLAADPSLHPALWGAFQLVGDAGPLSATRSAEPERLQQAVVG